MNKIKKKQKNKFTIKKRHNMNHISKKIGGARSKLTHKKLSNMLRTELSTENPSNHRRVLNNAVNGVAKKRNFNTKNITRQTYSMLYIPPQLVKCSHLCNKLYDYYNEHNNFPIIMGGYAIYLYSLHLKRLFKSDNWPLPADFDVRTPTDVDMYIPFMNGVGMTPYPTNFFTSELNKNINGKEGPITATALDTPKGSTLSLNGESADIVRSWGPLARETENWTLEQKQQYVDTHTNKIIIGGKEYTLVSLKELLDKLNGITYMIESGVIPGKTLADHEKKIRIIQILIHYFINEYASIGLTAPMI